MKQQDLLIELGTEELPPKALLKLSTAFADNLRQHLHSAQLSYVDLHSYATPRRLALLVKGLQVQQPDKEIDRRGPALSAAFDDQGNPTQAALGFAKSCGIDINQVEKLETEKGAWLFYKLKQAGSTTAALIPDMISDALNKLPIPKRMRWADLDAQFVRPVHWLIVLFGEQVIDCEILSVRSGQQSYGHRFHAPQAITINRPDEYVAQLAAAKVVVDFVQRRQQIVAQVEQIAKQVKGKAVIDPELLDEVTAMVEWPVAVQGNFEKRFLDVPQEALISTMAANQKYFHLLDTHNKLLPHFITLSNIESLDVQKVIEGNERVIRPRFADAEFFWKQDRKAKLASHVESLRTVLFQKELGSLYDKTQRVSKLATSIAKQLGSDIHKAERAASLCKCDLMTNMVFEFTELQGIMGRYYAQHDGEDAEVALAIDEHYMPRFAGDQLPTTPSGQAVAIADRLDTLLGIIAIGQLPTGDKDPYGLRRAALGVLRIMIEKNLSLNLQTLLEELAGYFDKSVKTKQAITQTVDFIIDRLKTYYLNQDIKVDVFESVRIQRPTQPNDFDARVRAVMAFQGHSAAEALAAANKRISNILKQADGKIPAKIHAQLLTEPAEQVLAAQLEALSLAIAPQIQQRNYTAILTELAKLREPVDAFFDNVMVMAEDTKVRHNRLALLNQLRNLFLDVADISQLQPGNA